MKLLMQAPPTDPRTMPGWMKEKTDERGGEGIPEEPLDQVDTFLAKHLERHSLEVLSVRSGLCGRREWVCVKSRCGWFLERNIILHKKGVCVCVLEENFER